MNLFSKYSLTVLASSAIAFTLPSNALAWNRANHFVTGEIAMRYLEPEVTEKVSEILKGKTIAEVSAWADEVRRERRETSPFHYLNVTPGMVTVTHEDLIQEKGNVYMAILDYADIVVDDDATPTEQEEALKFLIHFIGDLHQPLHCGYAEDLGGNSIRGFYFGEATNLHRIWDGDIISHKYGDASPGSVADQILSGYSQSNTWALTLWKFEKDPLVWVQESKDLLDDGFYPPGFTPGAESDGTEFELGTEYQSRHLTAAEKRLVQGGLRIAATLNELLDGDDVMPFAGRKASLPKADEEVGIVPPLFNSPGLPAESRPASQPVLN